MNWQNQIAVQTGDARRLQELSMVPELAQGSR